MGSSSEEELLKLLLHEHIRMRDDDRLMYTQFCAIIAVALTLIIAMAALFSKTCPVGDPNGNGLTKIPIWIYIAAPLVPVALFNFAIWISLLSTIRGYYIRYIENRIHALTCQQNVDLPMPCWGHLQLEVTGQAHAGSVSRLNFTWMYAIITLGTVGCLCLAIAKIPDLRLRIFSAALDVMLLTVPLYAGFLNVGRGARLWHAAHRGLSVRLQRTIEGFPEPNQPNNERSLASFLILPRNQEEILKALLIPICFAIARILIPQLSAITWEQYLNIMVFFIVFEFLVYQARYLFNDVRDRRVDSGNTVPKRRFPKSKIEDTIALELAFGSFILRIALAILIVFCLLPPVNLIWHLAFLISIGLIALLYESSRSKCNASGKASSTIATTIWTLIVAVVVGFGYGLRSVVGVWLAGAGDAPTLILVGLGASLLGSTFVTLTWALESTISDSHDLAAQKAHLLLFRTFVSRASIRDNIAISTNEKVLSCPQLITAPWCIFALAAIPVLVGFLLHAIHSNMNVATYTVGNVYIRLSGSLILSISLICMYILTVKVPIKLSIIITSSLFLSLTLSIYIFTDHSFMSIIISAILNAPMLATVVFRRMSFNDMSNIMSKVSKQITFFIVRVFKWFIGERA